MKTFLHLPKTGGTTIVNVLSNQIYFKRFKRINPNWFTHPKEFLRLVESIIDPILEPPVEFEVIGGHFGFAAHPKLDDPSSYFTVLRDPVERVISEYYYMRHNRMYYQELIHAEELSLSEYVNHSELQYLNNLQTRLISGVGYDQGDLVTEEIYQKALENLNRFSTIGLTERMEETLALFYMKLNWKRMPFIIKSNTNVNRPVSVTLEERHLIEEREKFDIQLYNKAVEVFENNLKKYMLEVDRLRHRISNPGIIYKCKLSLYKKLANKGLLNN